MNMASCVFPENTHTHPKDFRVSKAKMFKGKCETKLEFSEGGESSNKKTFVGGVWIDLLFSIAAAPTPGRIQKCNEIIMKLFTDKNIILY